jgi:hypothetical protein
MQQPGFAADGGDVGAARWTDFSGNREPSSLQDRVEMAVRRLYEADVCR